MLGKTTPLGLASWNGDMEMMYILIEVRDLAGSSEIKHPKLFFCRMVPILTNMGIEEWHPYIGLAKMEMNKQLIICSKKVLILNLKAKKKVRIYGDIRRMRCCGGEYHLFSIFRSKTHRAYAFVEIYRNCFLIFNNINMMY